MDIENPIALHFIMEDDLFFLKQDRETYTNTNETGKTIAEDAVAVIAMTVKTPVLETTTMEFSYKGKKGGMLILVHYPALEFIHDAHLSALENILKRKEIALADVAILNMAKHTDASFESIADYFKPRKILFLGEKALPADAASFKLNAPQQLDSAVVLYSFSFDEMMDSPDNKKAFWEQMKGF